MNKALLLPIALAALLLSTSAFAVTWVPGVVPDWDQPYCYVPPGADPNPPPVNTDPFDNWCSPTAAANLFGWWEDSSAITGIVLTGLTDRQAWNGTTAYANNAAAPLWQQGLWHDGTAELGWYMDANQWASNPAANGWPNQGTGTAFNAIGPGAVIYAGTAWADATSGLQKNAYTFNHRPFALGGGVTPAQAWADYIADISAGIPLLVSFDYWVDPDSEVDLGEEVYRYDFEALGGLGHTVTGVGFIDPNPNMMDGGEMFVVHDNWSTTQTNVAVPLWVFWTGDPISSTPAPWLRNDHFAYVPEPGLLLLLASGLLLVR
ncbi:MAG TPA: hypothetical protein VMW48_03195, partial [Vicinamibacterales bacterium]|nr:hypothetical protein [Vicinamibacterales bacterium]